jgi:hypothetical protein
MYNRAKSECAAPFSFTVYSRVGARATFDKKPLREFGQVNRHGDTYRKNSAGQVTYFRYSHSGKSFSFGWDAKGNVCTIDSSDGWSWTRAQDAHFDGWLARNYFDSWSVSRTGCHLVTVTEDGVTAFGDSPAQMGLPVRP